MESATKATNRKRTALGKAKKTRGREIGERFAAPSWDGKAIISTVG
jgi:hypothetical protein